MNTTINKVTELSVEQLGEIVGGKINWGSVAGHCIGGAVIGSFGGAAGVVSGCLVGGGATIIGAL
ncbi:TmhB bacteriocin enhancer peptide [Streptococcus hyovaginalis]|uniref:TmhB bacteriocin enhancer peptide n=1 Tax=Streptococcus hyovaginalis TaxID=149015 RepID=UPI0014795C30|nr:TmhB bacteriocin enhancer peptide [Streptococcus hyovaginalis]